MTTVPNSMCPALSPAQRMLGLPRAPALPRPRGSCSVASARHTSRSGPRVLALAEHTLLMLWVAGPPDPCLPGWSTLAPPHSQLSRAPPTVSGLLPASAGITDLSSVDRFPPPHSEDRDAHTAGPSKNGAKTQMHHFGGDSGEWPVRCHPTPALDMLPAPNTSPHRPVDSSAHPGSAHLQGLSTHRASTHSPGKTLSPTFTSMLLQGWQPPLPTLGPCSCRVHPPALPDPRAPDPGAPSLPAPPLPSL